MSNDTRKQAAWAYIQKWQIEAIKDGEPRGFVYFPSGSNFDCDSWTRTLSPASEYIPGVVAVNLDSGAEYTARGGDPDRGAREWSETSPAEVPDDGLQLELDLV